MSKIYVSEHKKMLTCPSEIVTPVYGLETPHPVLPCVGMTAQQ